MLGSASPVEVMQEATEHLLAKPLLLTLADKSQACRDFAIRLLIDLLRYHTPCFLLCIPCMHIACVHEHPSQHLTIAGCSRCGDCLASICYPCSGRKTTQSRGMEHTRGGHAKTRCTGWVVHAVGKFGASICLRWAAILVILLRSVQQDVNSVFRP